MFVAPPRCGLMQQHDAHWDNLYDRNCPGWTDIEAAVEDLCVMMVRWSRLVQLDPAAVPNEEHRLKLLVHPRVYQYLRTHIQPDFRVHAGPEVPMPPEIEVVIDSGLPDSTWRFEIARGAM